MATKICTHIFLGFEPVTSLSLPHPESNKGRNLGHTCLAKLEELWNSLGIIRSPNFWNNSKTIHQIMLKFSNQYYNLMHYRVLFRLLRLRTAKNVCASLIWRLYLVIKLIMRQLGKTAGLLFKTNLWKLSNVPYSFFKAIIRI
jgi:hypothetical protein